MFGGGWSGLLRNGNGYLGGGARNLRGNRSGGGDLLFVALMGGFGGNGHEAIDGVAEFLEGGVGGVGFDFGGERFEGIELSGGGDGGCFGGSLGCGGFSFGKFSLSRFGFGGFDFDGLGGFGFGGLGGFDLNWLGGFGFGGLDFGCVDLEVDEARRSAGLSGLRWRGP